MVRRKKSLVHFLAVSLLMGCMMVSSGCGIAGDDALPKRDMDISSELSFVHSMDLEYAGKFAVDCYEGGYQMLSIADGRRYLVVPEGKEEPQDLKDGIIVLKQPLTNIYLVASAAMDMFRELSAIDRIRFSGQKAKGWCIPEAREAMEQGRILYAGKYNMPDFEQIVSNGCSLAVENNMVSHSPEIVEKLEDFGIPVLIDFSSYEGHPLGRVEWIKLYGVLLEQEKEAEEAFRAQKEMFQQAAGGEATGKSVAFFYITANGMVNVRIGNDYVSRMIAYAGGKYVFEDLGDAHGVRSSMTMQMEEFYRRAKDADCLIYNSTVDGGLASMEELLQKEPLLSDFRAVKEGNVWCTTRDLYQQSMSVGQMMQDVHAILSDGATDGNEMKYLYPLE